MIQENILALLISLTFLLLLIVLLYTIYKKNLTLQKQKLDLEAYKQRVDGYEILHTKYEDLQHRCKSFELELTKAEVLTKEHIQRSEQMESFYESRVFELREEISFLKQDMESKNVKLNQKEASLSHLQTVLDEQKKSAKQQYELFLKSEERMRLEFENLAHKIFSDNTKKLNEQNTQSLEHLLSPVRTQLNEFKQKVEDVYIKDSKERVALNQELKNLKELNLHMSTEANRLTNALISDNKQQGIWGEMVLERVLENSGLRQGYEYRREVGLKDKEGRAFRPDVVVDLPDGRNIIIDAKSSLRAYSDYVNSKDENAQIYLKKHIASMRSHIKALSEKRYENLKGLNTLDFIFMFVPIEGALMLALKEDDTLYDEAYRKKIILVSSTTLLVALRAVENTWRTEKQAQNIALVYSRAEELYKKFSSFVGDMESIGKALRNAESSYEEAFKKLSLGRGNLVSQVINLKNISNIKPKKDMDGELVKNALLDS